MTAPTRMAGAAERLVRFPPLLFAQSLPRKRFLGPALFTGLHIEAMLLDFLDDVFLLHLALETAQSVLQRFTFLDDDFSHVIFTPNPVRIGILRCHYERCTAPGDYRMLDASFACVGDRLLMPLLINSGHGCQAIFRRGGLFGAKPGLGLTRWVRINK